MYLCDAIENFKLTPSVAKLKVIRKEHGLQGAIKAGNAIGWKRNYVLEKLGERSKFAGAEGIARKCAGLKSPHIWDNQTRENNEKEDYSMEAGFKNWDWDNMPPLLKVHQFVKLSGLGRIKAYDLCRMPGFPSFRCGKTILISRDGLRQWIEEQTQIGA